MPAAVGRRAACICTLLEVCSALAAIVTAAMAAADWCSAAAATVVGEVTAAAAAAAGNSDIMAGLMWARGLVR